MTLSGGGLHGAAAGGWRQINAYGIRIGHRTYDCPELGPWRLQHSGVMARRGLWEVHYDPYDRHRVFVRPRRRLGHGAVDPTADGRRAVRRVHLAACPAILAARGRDDTSETEVARVLDELLTGAPAAR